MRNSWWLVSQKHLDYREENAVLELRRFDSHRYSTRQVILSDVSDIPLARFAKPQTHRAAANNVQSVDHWRFLAPTASIRTQLDSTRLHRCWLFTIKGTFAGKTVPVGDHAGENAGRNVGSGIMQKPQQCNESRRFESGDGRENVARVVYRDRWFRARGEKRSFSARVSTCCGASCFLPPLETLWCTIYDATRSKGKRGLNKRAPHNLKTGSITRFVS